MPEDPVAVWIRLDKVLRRVIGHRMKHGVTPESDEALDTLRAMMARTERWLVN
jgi:hypothetical protein